MTSTNDICFISSNTLQQSCGSQRSWESQGSRVYLRLREKCSHRSRVQLSVQLSGGGGQGSGKTSPSSWDSLQVSPSRGWGTASGPPSCLHQQQNLGKYLTFPHHFPGKSPPRHPAVWTQEHIHPAVLTQ